MDAGKKPHGVACDTLTAPNSNRALKRMMVEAGFNDGLRYSARCFRIWVSEEFPNKGNMEAAIRSAGCWRGAVFKIYCDVQIADPVNIYRISASVSDSDSDDEAANAVKSALGDSIREKRCAPPLGGNATQLILSTCSGCLRWVSTGRGHSTS